MLLPLRSFNPVGGGSSRELQRFLQTAAVVVFQMASFSQQALQLQTQLHRLSQSGIDGVQLATDYSRIIGDFSRLLVDVELLLSMREFLYSELRDSFVESRENLEPGLFTWTRNQREKLQRRREELIQRQSDFLEVLAEYESLSTAGILSDFSNINRLANTIAATHNIETARTGVYSQTVTEKLAAIDLQRNIVLGALERFRNNIQDLD